MTRHLPLCLVLALTGCMSLPEYQSERSATAEQKAQDTAACDREVAQSNAGVCDQRVAFDRCMRNKGYRAVIGTGSPGLCHP
jgi:hypothetical protein